MDPQGEDRLSHRFRFLLELSRRRRAFPEAHDAARLGASQRGLGMGPSLGPLVACLEIQGAADMALARGEPG